MIRYDYKTLYEKNSAFWNSRPRAKRALLFSNHALTLLFFFAYAGLLAWAIWDDLETESLIKLLFVPLFCLFAVAVLRLAIDRPRPYSERGANITPILRKKSKDKESFPSRHLACAFVIATVFLPHFLGAGICLMLLGLLLGYIRFALGVHYPSDLFGGMALGLLCGLFLLV